MQVNMEKGRGCKEMDPESGNVRSRTWLERKQDGRHGCDRPPRWLCLNPTAQKDNRGVLGASFRAKEFSEIVGYSNMADYTLSKCSNCPW